MIQPESKDREDGQVLCPDMAAEINRDTRVPVMMEFGSAAQGQTLALVSHQPLIEVWAMSSEGELCWIKYTAPGTFANNLSVTCPFGHCSALI